VSSVPNQESLDRADRVKELSRNLSRRRHDFLRHIQYLGLAHLRLRPIHTDGRDDLPNVIENRGANTPHTRDVFFIVYCEALDANACQMRFESFYRTDGVRSESRQRSLLEHRFDFRFRKVGNQRLAQRCAVQIDMTADPLATQRPVGRLRTFDYNRLSPFQNRCDCSQAGAPRDLYQVRTTRKSELLSVGSIGKLKRSESKRVPATVEVPLNVPPHEESVNQVMCGALGCPNCATELSNSQAFSRGRQNF
jgi:hypothetical protein